MSLGLHYVWAVAAALGAEPLALGLGGERDAGEVEPLDGAEVVVAEDHLAEGDLVAEAVARSEHLMAMDVTKYAKFR